MLYVNLYICCQVKGHKIFEVTKKSLYNILTELLSKLFSALTYFIALVSLSIPPGNIKNQRFTDIFRGYRKRTVA